MPAPAAVASPGAARPASTTSAPSPAALAEAPDAGTVLNWLRGSRSARLLHDLTATGRPPSHTDLDATIDGRGTAMTAEYLPGLLIAHQVLEPRDELAVRIVRHLERTVARHPEHGALLRAYVRWSLLLRAKRRQAVRAGGVKHRIRWAYTRINLAAELLTTTGHGLTIATLDQTRLDTWLAANPGSRYGVRDFVVWAHRRHHALDLLVPHRPKADPVGLDEDSHWDLLHQCLTDTRLDLDVRAAGAILLLFGQYLTRIAALPTTALTTEDGTTSLTLSKTPVPLPAPLADLLTTLADRPAPQGWAVNTSAGWLFPGHLPGPTSPPQPSADAWPPVTSPTGPPVPPPWWPSLATCRPRSSARCSASPRSQPSSGAAAPPLTGLHTSKHAILPLPTGLHTPALIRSSGKSARPCRLLSVPSGRFRQIYTELREQYGGTGSWAWVRVRAMRWTASPP
ncbi:hypothetical protein [Streptomyces sp. NPDC045369]|uniref:hypothetical protein n=1 Tax=Streptomyces sp. NPDC045369 TaxID=3155732 RepID=UPI0033E5F213